MTEDNQQDVGELIDTQISQGGLLLGVENDAKENDENSDDTNNSGGSEDDSDEEDSEDEDAEAIARKLGDQLWADIQRARAVAPTPAVVKSPKEDAALVTMKKVLTFANSDPLVHSTLSAATVPGHPNTNLLELLKKLMDEGRVTPQAAGPLSQVLVKLAKSEVLFSPLPSLPSQVAKRKREEKGLADEPPSKKYTINSPESSQQAFEKKDEHAMEV